MKILITGGSGFIGTNTVEHYLKQGIELLNLDRAVPLDAAHRPYWRRTDIMDPEALTRAIRDFFPEYVIHLAARTDPYGTSVEKYAQNTVGVKNLVTALRETPSVKRVIFTSTQLVCARRNPTAPDDYETINFYGKSKKIGEEFLRSCGELPFESVIVRPTSIWGPWGGFPYRSFFRMIMKKRYFHMSRHAAVKTFGFVGNTVYQMETLLLHTPYEKIRGKVFYLGDRPPVSIVRWADEIAGELGIRIPTVPYCCFLPLAWTGDLLRCFGVRFPMTSYRLKNMTTSFENDLSEIFAVAPEPPYTRVDGIRLTLKWLQEHPEAK